MFALDLLELKWYDECGQRSGFRGLVMWQPMVDRFY